jgi:predicted MFS family arabinose efflux permease
MLSLNVFFKKRYFASAFFYSCFSLVFSTWVIYIPYVAEKLGITEGKIGAALFFAPVGAFVMIPICNRLLDRFGVGKMAFYSLCCYCIALYGPILANHYSILCVALFFSGMAGSSVAISINSLIATIEKNDHVYIMSGSHGFFSAGGMIGATIGSFLAAKLHNPILHISLLSLTLIAIQFYFRKEYFYVKGHSEEKQRRLIHNIKPLILIALVALIFMVAEGAIADWSALYLKKIVKIKLEFIGFGYAGFSLAMTIGRFFGDWVSKKLGSWKLIWLGSLVGLSGFMLVLLPYDFVVLTGFTIVGLGFSAIVPEVYRMAANVKGIKTTDGVSFISASANIGFLLGPVALGFLAELRTLWFSFMALSFLVAAAFLIGFIKHKTIINK